MSINNNNPLKSAFDYALGLMLDYDKNDPLKSAFDYALGLALDNETTGTIRRELKAQGIDDKRADDITERAKKHAPFERTFGGSKDILIGIFCITGGIVASYGSYIERRPKIGGFYVWIIWVGAIAFGISIIWRGCFKLRKPTHHKTEEEERRAFVNFSKMSNEELLRIWNSSDRRNYSDSDYRKLRLVFMDRNVGFPAMTDYLTCPRCLTVKTMERASSGITISKKNACLVCGYTWNSWSDYK
ncbi:MAG: hypothetical protein WCK89_04300 [bacterium]